MTLIAFLVLFTFVVWVHEGGHYLMARRAGVAVYQFSIGFGPKLFSKTIKGTEFSIGIIPLGGFVRVAGLDESEGQIPLQGQSYYDQGFLTKFSIIVAGAIFNIFSAILLYTISYMILGTPQGVSNRIDSVIPQSVAASVGFQRGDIIVRYADADLVHPEAMVKDIHHSKDQERTFVIQRGNQQLFFRVKPRYNATDQLSYVGFVLAPASWKRYAPWTALHLGMAETIRVTHSVLSGFWQLVTGRVSVAQLAGPVGIIKITGEVAQYGIGPFIRFAAFFSINLGVINLFPFPALDGGRLLLLGIQRVIGQRRLTKEIENKIHYIGFLVLMALILWVTYHDVIKLVKEGWMHGH